MKKLAILVLGLLMIGTVNADAGSPVETDAGAWGWVFQFEGLSNLGVSGYGHEVGAGMRYFLQDGLALRPGVELGISSDKDKTDDTEGKLAEDKVTDTTFGVNCALEKYMTTGKAVAPYIGAKAGFSMSKEKDETDDPDIRDREDKTTLFGIGAIAGFQWGFTEGISLGGEYELGVAVGSRKVEDTTGNTTETVLDQSLTRFGISTASLFVSIAM
jgi:opacity protein-like surface antigen